MGPAVSPFPLSAHNVHFYPQQKDLRHGSESYSWLLLKRISKIEKYLISVSCERIKMNLKSKAKLFFKQLKLDTKGPIMFLVSLNILGSLKVFVT